jgi:hypothetical protein
VLVVRVWTESAEEATLRARVTRTLDVAHGEAKITVAATPEQVESTVQAWLNEFLASGGGDAPVTSA